MLADQVLRYGNLVCPRSMPTRDIPHATLSFDMHYPVLAIPERKLSWVFMAAEPLWYMDGSDRLADIEPYNPRMREFSDDGLTLYGAYGPEICAQDEHVVNSLLNDGATRQAVITIWKQNPEYSKDIPCTVALQWRKNQGALDCHVFMRSSDVFLGAPYDWHSFSVLTARMACIYNEQQPNQLEKVRLGKLHYTAGSAHIYARDFALVETCLMSMSRHIGPTLQDSWVLAGLDGLDNHIRAGLERRRDKAPTVHGTYDPKPTWKEQYGGIPGVLSQDCTRCSAEGDVPQA